MVLRLNKESIIRYFCNMWFVYIILCEDKSLYTGISNNLIKRFKDHKEGRGGKYTRSHKPIKILYSEKKKSKSGALKREIEIKKMQKKDKLILIKNNKLK